MNFSPCAKSNLGTAEPTVFLNTIGEQHFGIIPFDPISNASLLRIR